MPLLTNVRILPLPGRRTSSADRPDGSEPVDILVVDGTVADIGRGLTQGGHDVIDGGGAWAIPGLWDQHVHCLQAGADRGRLDVAAATCADEVIATIGAHITSLDATGPDAESLVSASGYRSATWPCAASVAELDAVSGEHPVIAISGDCHNGWLNSAALRLLRLAPRQGVLEEAEWFEVMGRLRDVPAIRAAGEQGLAELVTDLNARGVIGLVDMEHAAAWRDWPARVRAGVDTLRVRASVYPERLAEALDTGMASGAPLDERGLTRMGPLKIISDGSLGTRTAYCCDPYAGAGDLASAHGILNYPREELLDLARRARQSGLEVALHAIGDAAIAQALDVFEATGGTGSIEHAQLVRWQDVPRMAELGLRASVQPAHVLDDRDMAHQCWPGREDRSFAFRTMIDAGVDIRLGSDAPVAQADPWLAIAAAVHRSGDEREAWHPEQHLTVEQAIAASTDGWGTISPGHPGDIILLADNPLGARQSTAEAAERLRQIRPLATILAGRVIHSR